MGSRISTAVSALPAALAIVLGCGSVPASPAAANERSGEKPFVEHVQAQIARETSALQAQGFLPVQKSVLGPAGRSQTKRFILRLKPGITYAMIAACDQDCDHVEIAIYDAERQQLSRSSKRGDVAIFSGTPDRGGLYEVEVTQPGRKEPLCHQGFLVLQQGGAVPPEGVIAASAILGTAPASTARASVATAPAVAAARFGMERRAETEITGANYRRFVDTSLGECERRCLAEERCRAVEFYVENRSCGLFDDTPNLRRARGVSASVKRNAMR